MGFAGYFLIVAEFIRWAKERGIPVGPGRGSGAGSVVAWSLGITDLDPLRFGLLFERFLNPERVSMPDFDIDFCQDRRDEVIRHVQREVRRTTGWRRSSPSASCRRAPCCATSAACWACPTARSTASASWCPTTRPTRSRLAEAIEGGAAAAGDDRRGRDASRGWSDIARQLEGLYRHASTHAAGVVIGDRPLCRADPALSRSALRPAWSPAST